MMHKDFEKFARQVNLACVIDHARAGNGFFLTIFDKHHEVISCPWIHYVYSYILTMFGDVNELDSKRVLNEWPRQQYLKLIYSDLDIDAKNFILKIGGNPDAEIDRNVVRKTFSKILSFKEHISRRDLIIATYYSYALGIGRNPYEIKYILVSDAISLRFEPIFYGFSGRIIDNILIDFPDAQLIHLVRDPRACVSSVVHQFVNSLGNMYGLKTHNALHKIKKIIHLELDRDSFFVFGFWIIYYSQSFKAIMRKKNEYHENFITVRNEDLNLNFCKTISYIADTLNISHIADWDKNEKFQPTMLGKPWKGTGAYNSRYSPSSRLDNDPDEVALRSAGPNRHVTERWKKKLKNNEIILIEKFLSPEFSAFGYEPASKNSSKLRWQSALAKPLRGELPSLRWLSDGWKSGKEIFRDRLFYTFTWPLYYILVRWAFIRVVNNTCVFKKDCFTDKNSAHEK